MSFSVPRDAALQAAREQEARQAASPGQAEAQARGMLAAQLLQWDVEMLAHTLAGAACFQDIALS